MDRERSRESRRAFGRAFNREIIVGTIVGLCAWLAPYGTMILGYVDVASFVWLLRAAAVLGGVLYAVVLLRYGHPPRALWLVPVYTYVGFGIAAGGWFAKKAVAEMFFSGILAHAGWLAIWLVGRRSGLPR